jgi:DHA1 family tetracycline resistance protein-like MFS transporter
VRTFLGFIAHEVLPSAFVLYADYRYGWDTARWALPRGRRHQRVDRVGWLIPVILARWANAARSLTGSRSGPPASPYGLAPTSALVWLGVPLQAMWGIANPASMALMTRRVPPTEQGAAPGRERQPARRRRPDRPGLFTQTFAAAIDGPRARCISRRAPGAQRRRVVAGGSFLASRGAPRPSR